MEPPSPSTAGHDLVFTLRRATMQRRALSRHTSSGIPRDTRANRLIFVDRECPEHLERRPEVPRHSRTDGSRPEVWCNWAR